MRFFGLFLISVWCVSCGGHKQLRPRFTEISAEAGIDFANSLILSDTLNPYTYRNFYNGGGVALGDINNDGLLDIYFTGNQVDNKLYLNKGNFVFEDITEMAGVSCSGVWSTGVTFADVNADGWLDIYVCKSGPPGGKNRHNELFINNGNLTFSESARTWGLDVTGLSVQASFFDFDKDGDLDCYLLSNSLQSVGSFDRAVNKRLEIDPAGGGNKFFVNEGGRFIDQSRAVGIYQSVIGFGLGITLGDFNQDSWIDIFVSNDFFERDYLYINNQHGGFAESLPEYFESISTGSMGADYADLDNDGVGELFVTEMLPDSLSRRKTKTIFENWNRFQDAVGKGYHYQFSRNVLQKKVGESYLELGRLAQMSATEWSWGALLFDMNNDGLRDVFVANGIEKDLLDRDYLSYDGSYGNVQRLISQEKNAVLTLISKMPTSQFSNYAFANEGRLKFRNVANEWGLDAPQNSTGSAYGDLDNDGDLDLVLNNCNSKASIYRNDAATKAGFSIELFSSRGNRFVVGATTVVFQQGNRQTSDNFTVRGFQSSSQSRMHFGIGDGYDAIDSVSVFWPEGGVTTVYGNDIKTPWLRLWKDSCVVAKIATGNQRVQPRVRLEPMPNRFPRHRPNGLDEFDRERLIPFMHGKRGPFLIQSDVNNDGLTDVYCGGGRGQSGFFLIHRSNSWDVDSLCLVEYAQAEEMGSSLFDANGDGYADLYIASGGRFYPKSSSLLADHLLINLGKGRFREVIHALPIDARGATSCSVYLDFDRDGDSDLVVAETGDPFVYGSLGALRAFRNDGSGYFSEVSAQVLGQFNPRGVVTDMVVTDFDKDGWPDIVLVGDWLGIYLLRNNQGILVDQSKRYGTDTLTGWWTDIESADLNNDGVPDFVVANHGTNTFFRVKDRMYVSDFDGNGSIEQVYCTYEHGRYFPIADRDELVSQIPSLKRKLLFYSDFAKMDIEQMLGQDIVSRSAFFEVSVLESIALLSSADGYDVVSLPIEAQFSPLYSLCLVDINQDGVMDVLAGGNNYFVKPQFGRFDASTGWLFEGKMQNGKFSFSSGVSLGVKGQIRDIEVVRANGDFFVFISKYDDALAGYRVVF